MCHFFHGPFFCCNIHFSYIHTLSALYKGVVVVTNSSVPILNIVPTCYSVYLKAWWQWFAIHQVLFPKIVLSPNGALSVCNVLSVSYVNSSSWPSSERAVVVSHCRMALRHWYVPVRRATTGSSRPYCREEPEWISKKRYHSTGQFISVYPCKLDAVLHMNRLQFHVIIGFLILWCPQIH